MTSFLPTKKNFGAKLIAENPLLIRQLDELYTDIANALAELSKTFVIDGKDPPANEQINSLYSIGDKWVRTDTNSAWVMTSRTSTTSVTWTIIT